ncbi:MAG: type 4a pilus biogenesis protein PilO [Desulfobacterales bacterium]|nr:type 4a pilus biogenesis protein PilO [Desulfobacterales bacterium]
MKNISLPTISMEPFFEKVEKISKIQRILIYVGSFVLLIGPIVYFSYLPKLQKIDQLTKESASLDAQLVSTRRQAAQLQAWRDKEKQAAASFNIAKRALPQTKEIPSLLASISESGQAAGLEFLLFKPQNEIPKEFYAEIPVSINVTGRYHDLAAFFDRVSMLPRLVNVDNIQLTAPAKADKLNITCTAITYRFIEAKPKAAPPKKRGAKK